MYKKNSKTHNRHKLPACMPFCRRDSFFLSISSSVLVPLSLPISLPHNAFGSNSVSVPSLTVRALVHMPVWQGTVVVCNWGPLSFATGWFIANTGGKRGDVLKNQLFWPKMCPKTVATQEFNQKWQLSGKFKVHKTKNAPSLKFIVSRLSRDCLGIVSRCLVLSRGCLGIVSGLSRDCVGTVSGLSRDCLAPSRGCFVLCRRFFQWIGISLARFCMFSAGITSL